MYFTLFNLESALLWFKDQEGRPVDQVGYLDLDYNYKVRGVKKCENLVELSRIFLATE